MEIYAWGTPDEPVLMWTNAAVDSREYFPIPLTADDVAALYAHAPDVVPEEWRP